MAEENHMQFIIGVVDAILPYMVVWHSILIYSIIFDG